MQSQSTSALSGQSISNFASTLGTVPADSPLRSGGASFLGDEQGDHLAAQVAMFDERERATNPWLEARKAGLGCPPDSTTGGSFTTGLFNQFKGQRNRYQCEIGLDWIAGSFQVEKLEAMRQVLAGYGAHFVNAAKGQWGYLNCELSPNGCFIAWTDGRDDAAFSVPGAMLAQLDAERMRQLWLDLNLVGFRASRLDIRFDDYDRIVEPRTVWEAFDAGCVPHFKKGTWMENRDGGRPDGATVYIGKRGQNGGGRCYCVYDKLLESGDDSLDCVRWELRLYHERAELARAFLAGATKSDEAFITALGQLVGGNIHFHDRSSGDPNLSRCPTLPWWQIILDSIGSVKINPRRICPTLLETVKAVQEQYAPTMAMLDMVFKALGGDLHDFIDEMRVDGASRMRRSHRARVDECIESLQRGLVCSS